MDTKGRDADEDFEAEGEEEEEDIEEEDDDNDDDEEVPEGILLAEENRQSRKMNKKVRANIAPTAIALLKQTSQLS